MRRVGVSIGMILAVALTGSPSARAQLATLATANVTEGGTNNALYAPDGDPTLGPDAFTTVRVSLQEIYQGALHDQGLAYTYAGTFYVVHPQADGQTHDLLWRLHATPTGRTELTAALDGRYSHLNSVNPLAAAGVINPQNVATAGAVIVPSGSASFWGAAANVTGLYRQNAHLLWSETTTLNAIEPISGDLPSTLGVTQGFHHEHIWTRDALTLDLSLGYAQSEGFTAQDGTVFDPTKTGQVQAMAGYRRDLSPTVFVSASAGVLAADTSGQTAVGPIGTAVAHYQRDLAFAELALTHTSQLQPFLGEFVLTDGATARALLPLDRLERFRLVGYGTVQRGSIISGGSFETLFDLLAADVGITYKPLEHQFLASIDYNVQDQIGNGTLGAGFSPNLHRQAVLLTLTGTWSSQTGLR